MSQPYREWALATVTGNDVRPLLVIRDATIGNEFPESYGTLEFEMLHFDAELERMHN